VLTTEFLDRQLADLANLVAQVRRELKGCDLRPVDLAQAVAKVDDFQGVLRLITETVAGRVY
jgi:hypothetical protein